MKLAYIDESGDTGDFTGQEKSGTQTFTLGCVVIPAAIWAGSFEQVINWRRDLKKRFDVPVRAEIKANYLLGSRGPFKQLELHPESRRTIFQEGLELLDQIGAQVFGVVVNKSKFTDLSHSESFNIAWNFVLQRLEKQSSISEPLLIVHDDGEQDRVRTLARRARRAGMAGSTFGSGGIQVPLVGLLDDPVSRNSAESYFIQLADLVAYSAFRKSVPQKRTHPMAPYELWDSLGSAVYVQATLLKPGNSPGIVVWPK